MTTNQALVFVKPHAVNDAVKKIVTEGLEKNKIRILSSGEVHAEKIDSDKIIDKHYATIARYAMEWSAEKLPVPEDTQEKFKSTFGVAWKTLLEEGKILNASEAAAKLGGISASELTEKWKSNTERMKLAPGLYVTKFQAEDIYVINGFYLLNREKFTKTGAVVSWYTVEWNEEDLPWVDFRAKVIGPTNPEQAPPESLRGIIFKEWSSLGLSEQPNVSDNGVHASAGPLEGLVERMTWVGATLNDDAFAKRLKDAGADMSLIEQWLGNIVATIDGNTAPIFDLLEDKQSTDVVNIAVKASKPTEAKADAAPSAPPAAAPAAGKVENPKRVFTDEEKANLELIFKLFDEDNSGTISAKELPGVVRFVGYTPTEAACKDLMARYDANNDGQISLDEFYHLCATEDIQRDSDEDLRAAFAEFDVDKNGYLSKKELQDALATFGEPLSAAEIDDMFKGIDTNGDGKICIDEFLNAMRPAAK